MILNVVVIKPSKYDLRGYVERFMKGFMPNATLPFIHSMIPDMIGAVQIRTREVDEYVHTDLGYLDFLDAKKHGKTLVLLVGVQSHQFQRALDLAALAISRGCMAVIGGPHPMTCDTTMLQGNGVSFALAEADSVLMTILHDAVQGKLRSTYGEGERWARKIDPPPLKAPSKSDLKRYVTCLRGVYPARGCPYVCDFCSVIKIAGRNIRSQPIETTLETLRVAQEAGVKSVFFTSDNFNKYTEAKALCDAIVDEGIKLRYFVQCDTQIVRQPDLLQKFAKAGVFQIFLGVESLSLEALKGVHKMQNRPDQYREIKLMCDEAGINSHFSLINGFPTDTTESILEQLAAVKEIDPSMASFYTLCPIPGTAQYDEFKRADLIFERNLDRFDTIRLTWEHPNLSAQELAALFSRCYRRFYSSEHLRRYKPRGNQMKWSTIAQYSAFVWWCSLWGDHPMSGGVGRWRCDHATDYRALRYNTYGYDLVPLPESLVLSAKDEVYNRKAKIVA